MAWHTLKEAQDLTGKSRRTLYRDMAQGHVSWELGVSGQRQLETCELLRYYGKLNDVAQTEPSKMAHRDTPPGDEVLAELKALRTEVSELRATLLRLEHKPASKLPISTWWQRFISYVRKPSG